MARRGLYHAECKDMRSGLHQRSAGEWATLCLLKEESFEIPPEEMNKLVSLAEKDLREAECVHEANSVWKSDCWLPIYYDSDLFTLLAIIYISKRLLYDKPEFEACHASCADTVTRDELQCLVSLGEDFKSCSANSPCSESLEHLWQLLGRSSRSITAVIKDLLLSSYFVSYPSRTEGPACATALAFVRAQLDSQPEHVAQFRELEKRIVQCYEREAVVLTRDDWIEYFRRASELGPASWGCLTTEQGIKLLTATNCIGNEGCEGTLLASLISLKPPNSAFLPHLLALFDCATHARLWLFKCHLPIYYIFQGVKYSNLGENEHREVKVLTSPEGFLERVPSLIEREQRFEAIRKYHELHWAGDHAVVLPIRSPICRLIKVPVLVTRPEDTDVEDDDPHTLVAGLHYTLWYEPLNRLADVVSNMVAHPSVAIGKPDQQELLLRKYRNTSEFLNVRAIWKQKMLDSIWLRRILAMFISVISSGLHVNGTPRFVTRTGYTGRMGSVPPQCSLVLTNLLIHNSMFNVHSFITIKLQLGATHYNYMNIQLGAASTNLVLFTFTQLALYMVEWHIFGYMEEIRLRPSTSRC